MKGIFNRIRQAVSEENGVEYVTTTLCEGKKQLEGRLAGIKSYKRKTPAAVLLMIVISLLLAGCAGLMLEFTGTDSSGDLQKAAMQAYEKVLKGESVFYDADDGGEISINGLSNGFSALAERDVEIAMFTLCDIDGDAVSELALWLRVDDSLYSDAVILHYNGEKVVGLNLKYRAFQGLKPDGSFFSSDSDDNYGVATIKFTEEGGGIAYTARKAKDKYFLNEESATKEEFDEVYSKYLSTPDIIWHLYTSDNVEKALSQDGKDKTVSFAESMTYDTLTDTELKNKVFTTLDSIDPSWDQYMSRFPNPKTDDPESYAKMVALGTDAIPYILLYINEHRELDQFHMAYFYYGAESMAEDAAILSGGSFSIEELEWTEDMKEVYPVQRLWQSYELLRTLEGQTLAEISL